MYTLYNSPLHTQSSLVVSWQRIYNSLTVTSNYTMKTFFHSLINFLPLFCNCQLNYSAPKFISWQTGVSELNFSLYTATASFGTLLYNHFAWTTQKTQHFNCSEGVFTAPLHNNGSYSIVANMFAAAGICLPSRCLTMNVYSDFAIPAFGRHVTIFNYKCIIIIREFILSMCETVGLTNKLVIYMINSHEFSRNIVVGYIVTAGELIRWGRMASDHVMLFLSAYTLTRSTSPRRKTVFCLMNSLK
jgi:hypothetical protein